MSFFLFFLVKCLKIGLLILSMLISILFSISGIIILEFDVVL